MQSPYDPAKLSAQNLWRAVKIAVADMSEPRGAIHSLAASTDASHRLRAIEAIREQIAEGQAPEEYAQLCRKLIADADNNCRWQALILAGEWIQLAPELVWSLVLEFGASGDEDMRTGVATVLLEHLLDYDFDTFFPRLRSLIEAGHPMLADTLRRCWAFGKAEPRWDEVSNLLRQHGS